MNHYLHEIENTNQEFSKNRTAFPKPFQCKEYGYLLIPPMRKEPPAEGWQKNPPYKYDDPDLIDHLKQGGNVAIRCGDGGATVFDADELDRLRTLGVIDKLPLTTTWETRPGREQRLYICNDWNPDALRPFVPHPETAQVKLFDPELHDPKNPNAYLHLGEIQGPRHYAVIPPSVKLINGKEVPYRMLDDREPAVISITQLLQALESAGVRFSPTAKEGESATGPSKQMVCVSTIEKARDFLETAKAIAIIGNRNDKGFWLASQLRDLRIDHETAVELMTEYAKAVPQGDGWNTAEALRTLESAYNAPARDPPQSGESSRNSSESIATRLVNLALNEGSELWHSKDRDPYISLPNGNHHEHYPLSSKVIRQWLGKLFYDAEGKSPGLTATQEAINVLEGKALFGGPEYEVFVRAAEHDTAFYVDLGDSDWHIIKITAEGWEVIQNPPVRFRRPDTMQPLPMPERNGDWKDLRPLLNAKEDRNWILIVGWMMQAFWPRGPYAHLSLVGEQGSAKSVTQSMIKLLIDPSRALLRRPPRDERNLMIAGRNERIVSFDNLSGVPSNLSDALCVMSTGGALASRTLYTDMDEAFMCVQRPVIMNGIDAVGSRGDLLDRTIVIELPPIDEDQRRSEKDVMADFEKIRPKILGLILDATVMGMKRESKVHVDKLPRMADFLLWVMACEPALPWKEGEFLKAYQQAREDAIMSQVEDDRFANAVYRFASGWFKEHKESFEGTPTKLWDELILQENMHRNHIPKGWPKDVKALGSRLNRVAPALRARGVNVTHDRTGKARAIRLEFKGDNDDNDDKDSPDKKSGGPEPPTPPSGRDRNIDEYNNLVVRKRSSPLSLLSHPDAECGTRNGDDEGYAHNHFTPEEDRALLQAVGKIRQQYALLKVHILVEFVRPIMDISPHRCMDWLKANGGLESVQGVWKLPEDVLAQADALVSDK